MKNLQQTTENAVPVLYEDMHSYKELLKKEPSQKWIKYNNGVPYIPIGIVEQLLTKVFPFWQVEHHGTPQVMGNSVVVSVHLKVYHPILNEWLTFAGIGAVPIQVQKGAHPTDWTKINAMAMHKNVPAALSFAINNAAKKIGILFGANLGRNEQKIA